MMRLSVEMVPANEDSARVLGEWRDAWELAGSDESAAIDPGLVLPALLDLKDRGCPAGFTVNLAFPDNK